MKNIIFKCALLTLITSSCLKEPNACFDVDKTTAQVSETITFSDCSTNTTKLILKPGVDASGVPIALSFQNGKAQFTYNQEGTYNVQLEALNCKSGNKCKNDVVTKQIIIKP